MVLSPRGVAEARIRERVVTERLYCRGLRDRLPNMEMETMDKDRVEGSWEQAKGKVRRLPAR